MPRERSALKYHCVINNPEKKGITSKSLEALLRAITTLVYFAFGLHTTPTTGTKHFHLFIWFKNSTTFSRVKKLLPEGTHIEAAKGNAEQNIDYIINSGPHKDKDTYVKDSLVLFPNIKFGNNIFDSSRFARRCKRRQPQNMANITSDLSVRK